MDSSEIGVKIYWGGHGPQFQRSGGRTPRQFLCSSQDHGSYRPQQLIRRCTNPAGGEGRHNAIPCFEHEVRNRILQGRCDDVDDVDLARERRCGGGTFEKLVELPSAMRSHGVADLLKDAQLVAGAEEIRLSIVLKRFQHRFQTGNPAR